LARPKSTIFALRRGIVLGLRMAPVAFGEKI